jgi:hypothetical protein
VHNALRSAALFSTRLSCCVQSQQSAVSADAMGRRCTEQLSFNSPGVSRFSA